MSWRYSTATLADTGVRVDRITSSQSSVVGPAALELRPLTVRSMPPLVRSSLGLCGDSQSALDGFGEFPARNASFLSIFCLWERSQQ